MSTESGLASCSFAMSLSMNTPVTYMAAPAALGGRGADCARDDFLHDCVFTKPAPPSPTLSMMMGATEFESLCGLEEGEQQPKIPSVPVRARPLPVLLFGGKQERQVGAI